MTPPLGFASPLALVALAMVPLLGAGYVVLQRRRGRAARPFVSAAMLPNLVDRAPGWRRHLPVAVLLLALTALLVGVARPSAVVPTRRNDATVMLVLDTSRSMAATDVRPTRLAAAKTAAARFIDRLPETYRVGVVVFSTTAEVAAPATRDRAFVMQALQRLRPKSGTALGEGIARALDVGRAVPRERDAEGRPGRAPPVAMLLFTDGIEQGGELSAAQAIVRARRLRIPVSTAVVGTADGIVRAPGPAGLPQIVRVPADSSGLRTVARFTGGRFFAAPQTQDLSPVYRDLRSRAGMTRKREEITFAFALGGAVLLLVGSSLATVWSRRAL
jgi:Ca-activated chloride channel family protein